MRLILHVIPRARKNEIVDYSGNVLKLRVTAPPEKGKANIAVLRLLSDVFDVSPSSVVFISGLTSRKKVVEIPTICENDILKLLKKNRPLFPSSTL